MSVDYAAPISAIGAPKAAPAEHVGPYLGHRVDPVARHLHQKEQRAAAHATALRGDSATLGPAAAQPPIVESTHQLRPGVSVDIASHTRMPASPLPSYRNAVQGARKSVVNRVDLRSTKLQLHEEVPDIHDEDSVLPDKAVIAVRQRDLDNRAPVQIAPDKHVQAEVLAKYAAVQNHMANRAASDPRSLARPKIGLTTSSSKAAAPVAKETLVDALIKALTGMPVSEAAAASGIDHAVTAAEYQVESAVRALVQSLHADPRAVAAGVAAKPLLSQQSAARSAFYALRPVGVQALAARPSAQIAIAA